MFFDYKLNFLISRHLVHSSFSVPVYLQERYLKLNDVSPSTNDFVSAFFSIENRLNKKIEIYSVQSMLPCELLVLLPDWTSLNQMEQWNFGSNDITIRCFGLLPSVFEELVSPALQNKFKFQLVQRDRLDL